MIGCSTRQAIRQVSESIRSSSVEDRAEVRHDKVRFFLCTERDLCSERADAGGSGMRTEAEKPQACLKK